MTKTSKRRSGFPTESPIWYWQWVALLIEALDPATLLFMWRAQCVGGAAWVYPAKGDLVVVPLGAGVVTHEERTLIIATSNEIEQ